MEIREVSSTEFAARFGFWSFEAQKAPIRVVNKKTGSILGHFVADPDFQPSRSRAIPAWQLSDELASELEKPLKPRRPELDHLMKD
jgi:hypothetical protein